MVGNTSGSGGCPFDQRTTPEHCVCFLTDAFGISRIVVERVLRERTDYLRRRWPSVKQMSLRTLIVSQDGSLLRSREMILKLAGLSSFSTNSVREAERILKEGCFGAVILCYTLTDDERKHLDRVARENVPKAGILKIRSGYTTPSDIFTFALSSIRRLEKSKEQKPCADA